MTQRQQPKALPIVILAFYRDHASAALATRETRRRGFRRVASIYRSTRGAVETHTNALTPLDGAMLGAVLALGLLIAYFSGPLVASQQIAAVWPAAVIVALLGTAIGWLLACSIDAGVSRRLLARYGPAVLPGDALVIVQAPLHHVDAVLSTLRRPEFGEPATFAIRQPYSPAGPAGERPRHERYSAERLERYAARLAARQTAVRRDKRAHPLWDRLRASERTIQTIRAGLLEAARLEESISLAAEWLLDNAYVIKRHIGDVRDNLSKSFYDVLPVLDGEREQGVPRVYRIATELVTRTDAELRAEDITRFLRAYQEVTPLTIGELWALPLMLRLALIEYVRDLAVGIDCRQQADEQADFWAHRLLNAERRDPDLLMQLLGELAREQPDPPVYFADRLVSQLHGEGFVLDPVRGWLERKLGATLPEVITLEQRHQAADQVTIANAITSLRHLARIDWRDVFEQVNPIDTILRADPASMYARLDFSTRDRYRHTVEEIARRSPLTELEVARAAVELARAAGAGPAGSEAVAERGMTVRSSTERGASAGGVGALRRRHIGYFLIDEGRIELEAAAHYHVPLRQRLRRWIYRHPALVYLGGIGAATSLVLAALVAAATIVAGETPLSAAALVAAAALGALALFPASEVAVQTINYVVTRLLPPRVLPKLSFEEGIPDRWRTLVVVPMLLRSPETIAGDLELLEIRFLANQDPNLHYALLADFPDAPDPAMPGDAELLETAIAGIERLNARYGRNAFSLFYRERTWNETEQVWMGWERKRGKLEELNRFLVAHRSAAEGDGVGVSPLRLEGSTLHHVGDAAQVTGVRFVITLDADTQLPHGAARRLVETLAHPLNRPRLAPDGRTVTGGYTIIQPRVSTALPSAVATRFSRTFTDPVGTDPYTRAISDVYQDLAGEGSYIGKAIYDVAMFHRVLDSRFPDALLLSHDLVEGAHVRTGLATDIELFDQFPDSYLDYSRREHRWIRGDWQVADWCTPRVPTKGGKRVPNPLSALNRWKIFDNLRRSLLPAAMVVLLVVTWLAAPRLAPIATGLCALVLVLPPALRFLDLLTRPRAAIDVLSSRSGRHEISGGWVRALLYATFLPHQALVALDAIVRVRYRRLISRRALLQWQPSGVALRSAAEQERRLVWHMAGLGTMAAMLGASLISLRPEALLAAAPFVVAWLTSPAVLQWLQTNPPRGVARALAPEDRALLRGVARLTWRYFDDFVGPQTNWLPPDNYQEGLRAEVAPRTSPTNIGLWLLSTLAAHDFGYDTIDGVFRRGQATVETLGRLERFEGHLLNWYDVATLAPLPPRYVSSVDSGNLLASLWALCQGYIELLDRPLLGPDALHGLHDTLACLRDSLPAVQRGRVSATEAGRAPEAQRSPELVETLEALFAAPPSLTCDIVGRLRSAQVPARALAELLPDAYWPGKLVEQLDRWLELVDRYLPWLERVEQPPEDVFVTRGVAVAEARRQALAEAPSLRELAAGAHEPLNTLLAIGADELELPETVARWLAQMEAAAARARWLAGERLAEAEHLIARSSDLADEMNLRFLYDPERRLFSIGYSVEERRLDPSSYDLLASEARLCSFVAIARGDVPVEHWLTLGRPYGAADGRRVLLSWSGSMFEYLMPLLLTRSFDYSLLDAACRTAVAVQIAYGEQHGVPWGISEAAFSAVDLHQIYQYHAFGVPALGLKRGLEEDLVIAPYATALALMVKPEAALRNLRTLDRHGMRGQYGYHEAVDFTRRRQSEPGKGVLVQAYMAHHQGMSLLAIDNVLYEQVMQARFHRDPRVEATQPLLYERIPVAPPLIQSADVEERPPRAITTPSGEAATRFAGPHSPTPRTQLLSNGSYGVMVTSAGGGYSRWRDVEISRWRADTTCDDWGSFFYVKDLDQGDVWSTAYQPVRRAAGRYAATFATDRVTFERRDAGIGTRTEIVVSPEDDVEIRRLTLVNHSSRPRRLEVTSYVELALAPHNADRAHPAFGKLFVQTAPIDGRNALLAWRKPRSHGDPPVWAIHRIVLPSGVAPAEAAVRYETDRARFIGRGRSTENPAALESELSNATGYVLDPIFSLRCPLEIEPGQRVELAFVTGAADTREGALALAERYDDARAVERAFELAWSQAQLEPRHLRVSALDLQRYQQLASYMLYPSARLRAAEQILRRNQFGQRALWAYGITGDLPIMVVTIGDSRDLDVVREALMAHTFWRLRGFRADLVILNEEAASYEQPLHEVLQRLVQSHAQYTGIDQPGGIFLRPARQLPEVDMTLLLSVARVVLVASRGPVVQQLSTPVQVPLLPPPLLPSTLVPEEPSAPLPFLELPYFNGLGGFTPDGREYAIYLGPGITTPAPWVNVMANPEFGALVSESGQGFAWYGNSQINRLLPWSNDPVTDPVGDAIYIRDEESGVYWSPTPLPVRELDAYRARHGQGYSIFEHNSHAIEQELLTFVPMDDDGGAPLRIQRLRLRNRSSRRRCLSVTSYAEWVLGGVREDAQQHVITSWDAATRTVFARNAYTVDYGHRVAFAASNPPAASFTADRMDFLGRNGTAARPAALSRQHLSGRAGAGLDPCAALLVVVEVDPGQEVEVVFLLGEAADATQARALVQRYRDPEHVEQALQATIDWWDRFLGTIQVETPDLAVNFLLNRWLLYQTLSCRYWGRSAYYQSGGAFGFRDQLQDCMAFVHAAPDLSRAHILEAARHQFREGDVQHWWHPPSDAGVRTRFSDDLLWLPYVVAYYVRTTGDTSILDEVVPFLEGRLLEEGEHESYFVPDVSNESGTLLEHCRRAIAQGLTHGPHGLPLIGSGDWNDGLNLVGAGGKGESVWLAWFLIDVLDRFAAIVEQRGEHEVGAEYRAQAARLAAAVEDHAWDGEWYRRAYFDDGTPLGSKANTQAQIDSLPQSWAVISGAADEARARQAMAAVDKHLVREAERLVLLFTPPFEQATPDPGYIQGYPPGVRENGGQYTHGAIWVAIAQARLGDGDRAVELLRLMNPVEHARTAADAARYAAEPYVVAADIYRLEGHVGRGGWTWYTGSSGWMYRAWLEEVLGFKRDGKALRLDPAIASHWPHAGIRYRHGSATYDIAIENPEGVTRGVLWIELDGRRLTGCTVPLRDDGRTHHVVVRLGHPTATGLKSVSRSNTSMPSMRLRKPTIA